MIAKKYTEAQIKELMSQYSKGDISFSRFVEILNEQRVGISVTGIELLNKSLGWLYWLEEGKNHGLDDSGLSNATSDIYKKLNEVIIAVNMLLNK